MTKWKNIAFMMVIVCTTAACVAGPRMTASLPAPSQLKSPEAIHDNTGKYMSPYTEDGVLADWVDMEIKVKAGSQIGSAAGSYAGSQLLDQIPFVGSFIGDKAGEMLGKEIALKNAGGMKHIIETSDTSFNSVDDMAVYLYVNYSSNAHYQDALNAAFDIYPELKTHYRVAISHAASAE